MNLSHLMHDTVTVASRSGYADGKPTFGTPATIKARVEHKTKMVRTEDGRLIESDHAFATESEVTQQDRVWLPGDSTSDANAARRPITVKKATTLSNGYTFYEVYL